MSKKQNNVSSKSKKLIKQLIRESKPEPFVIDGKVVYFFFNSKITQTYLPSLNVHIYRYQNGTLEKHYANGKKELLVLK